MKILKAGLIMSRRKKNLNAKGDWCKCKWVERLMQKQKPMVPEYSQLVNEHFWELLADEYEVK